MNLRPVDDCAQGSLGLATLPEILRSLWLDQASGVLEVTRAEVTKRLHFGRGALLFASSDDLADELGERLIRQGKLKRADVDLACRVMHESGELLGKTIVEMGFLSAEEMLRSITEQNLDIIFSVFSWDVGEYRFEPGPAPPSPAPALHLNTAEILLEGTRRISDPLAVRVGVGAQTGVLRHPPESHPDLRVNQNEAFVLSRVDGRSSILDIVAVSPLGEDETLRCTYSLLSARVLDVIEPEPPAPKPHPLPKAPSPPEEAPRAAEPPPREAPPPPPPSPDAGRKSAEFCFQEGRRHFERGHFFDAIEVFREAVRLEPGKAPYHRWLAKALAKNPKWRLEAVEEMKHAIALEPFDSDSYLFLSELYETVGLLSRAREALRKAVSLDPESALSRRKLAPEEKQQKAPPSMLGRMKGLLGFGQRK